MTAQECDTLFGFSRQGHAQTLSTWLPHSFWRNHNKPRSQEFQPEKTKASFFQSKVLWYVHNFLTYTFNSRGQSNEVISLDDIFILHYLVNDEHIVLGRFLQWRLWLVIDSVSGVFALVV